MKNTIILTGGGTAGHVIPNIALIPKLRQHFDEIYYIGSNNGIEKDLIAKQQNINYIAIPTTKLIRKLSLKNVSIPFVLINSIMKCIKIIKQIKPKVIFAKGGYVSVPVVIAGALLKIPIIAHESDSTIGLANKLIYKKCNTMFFSFREAMKGYEKKGVFSGSPIREEFLTKNKSYIQSPSPKPTITIVGGSLGSSALNTLIINSLPNLNNYNIIHIVGKGKLNNNIKSPNYTQIEFVDDIASLYAKSDIVISRAGSNAIFELLAMTKPMILIPLPKDESRGDQIINAHIFEKLGYAVMLDQKTLTSDILTNKILYLLQNKTKYISKMQTFNNHNANKTIVDKLLTYI